MFNIRIPQNFDSPYKARNFQEYWRRWHMTLSRFLSAYIFKSVYRHGSRYRNYYVATMITFLVSGFWHGAGWTFVVWGLVNGFLVCTASWMNRKGKRFPFALAFSLTVLGVVAARVLFVAPSFADAFRVYKGMLNFASLGKNPVEWIKSVWHFIIWHKSSGLRLAAGVVICWFLPNSKTMAEKFKTNVWTMLYSAGLLFLCLIQMNKVVQFLYFQF